MCGGAALRRIEEIAVAICRFSQATIVPASRLDVLPHLETPATQRCSFAGGGASNRFFSLATDSEDEEVERRTKIDEDSCSDPVSLIGRRNSRRRLRLSWSECVRVQQELRERQEQRKERQRQRTGQGGETSTQLEFRRSLQIVWQVGTQSERVLARLCSGNGGSSEFFLEFDSAERSGHYVGAAKTAAVIQEVDEDESGWIFGVVGRSGTAATTDRDEVWDE